MAPCWDSRACRGRTRHDMLGECQARPAACDAALASPERRAKDCRHWETAFERPGARRNVRVPQPKHLRGRPGVRGLRRHRSGPEGRAQSPDGRAHRLSGSAALDAGPRSCCPRISTNENPAFARFDASHASPFDVTASDFKRGIPKETSRESAVEVAYARSYEEPTPGSGDRPFPK